jgi:hypothetical protein
MKLCPQCAFIYEDDQKVCDMDGKALVNAPAPAVMEPAVSAPTRMTIDLSAESKSKPARRWPLLVVLIVVLATLLSVVVLAQVRRSRSIRAVQSPQPPRSAAPKLEPSAADRVSSSSVEVSALAEDPDVLPEAAPADAAPLSRGHLATTPVSAGDLGGSSRVFLLRLTNGATIKADEVWEKKEGIWYRQAGMVTFLKRSQVRTIERVASPQPKTATPNVAEATKKSDERTAQNQLRIRRLEPVETKKPSRVKSFLKLTGRMLTKPFRR